jgi:lipopolysaccharide transport system permease protein
VRDVAQFVGILVMVLMFMSPIFYRISSITDEAMLACLYVNPLTVSIEQTRGVMFWGRAPDAVHLGIALAACALFCWLGFAFFQKTRRGFADVL